MNRSKSRVYRQNRVHERFVSGILIIAIMAVVVLAGLIFWNGQKLGELEQERASLENLKTDALSLQEAAYAKAKEVADQIAKQDARERELVAREHKVEESEAELETALADLNARETELAAREEEFRKVAEGLLTFLVEEPEMAEEAKEGEAPEEEQAGWTEADVEAAKKNPNVVDAYIDGDLLIEDLLEP